MAVMTLNKLCGAIAVSLARSRVEGYTLARRMVEAGLASPGRAGRGGAQSPPATSAHGGFALFALATGVPAKQAVQETRVIWELPFIACWERLVELNGTSGQPLPLPDTMHTDATFGQLIAHLVDLQRKGPLHELRLDSTTFPHGFRFGQGEGQIFANYERRSGVMSNGAILCRYLKFGRLDARASDALRPDRIVFIPSAALFGVAAILGPLAPSDSDVLAAAAATSTGDDTPWVHGVAEREALREFLEPPPRGSVH
jgi:hypothetical protein